MKHKIQSIVIMCMMISAPVWASNEMVKIEGGSYRPLYLKKNMPKNSVKSYQLDKYPVTNAEFHAFVRKHPEWQRNNVPHRRAEVGYLRHWVASSKNHFAPKATDLNKPVTNISWFAAHAYCTAQGKRLPTIDEWEFAGLASEKAKDGSSEPNYSRVILDWYAEGGKRGLRDVGKSKPNFYGIYDMHGLIWEWTEDFNSSLLNAGTANSDLFCGGGASNSTDPNDYASFMRYGMRTSVQANFVLNNMGFRCAKPL